jgi:F0F1-type ATP synthase assembly protein I
MKYSSLGLQLMATLAIAGWIGWKLDAYFHFTFPVFLLSLILLAFAAMMYKLYRSLNE